MANCSVFSIWTPGESHLEDEAFITTHCLPPYSQVIIYSLGLALHAIAAFVSLGTFVWSLMNNRWKMGLVLAALGVFSFGMFIQIIWFICLLLHTGFVLRYIVGGIAFCCILVSCYLLSYGWWRVITTTECFNSVSRQIEDELKRIKKIAIIGQIVVVVVFLIIWTLTGVFRQQGHIWLTNLFLALDILIFGLTIMVTVIFVSSVVYRFQQLVLNSEAKYSDDTIQAIQKIKHSAASILFAGVFSFLFLLSMFIWYLITMNNVGMANFLYVMFFVQCFQFVPGAVFIKLNLEILQRNQISKSRLSLNMSKDAIST